MSAAMAGIRLVVNADDLGLHPRIDEGIFRAHAEGVVTGASLLATGRFAEQAVQRAKAQQLPVGLHLALTSHLEPAAPPRLVRWLAPGGRFRGSWAELSAAWLARLVPPEEVEVELRAQLDRARELGAELDHLDTHQNLHLLPGLTAVVEGLAAENDLPVRWPADHPNAHWLVHPRSAVRAAVARALGTLEAVDGITRVRTHGVFEKGRLTERRLLRLVNELKAGDHEIVCHPGLSPGKLKEDPSWSYGWEGELKAVTSPRVREAIARRGIELIGWQSLRG